MDIFTLFLKQCKCDFISDLPRIYKLEISAQFIDSIKDSDYTLEEWKELYSYLTRTAECSLGDVGDIKEAISSSLEK